MSITLRDWDVRPMRAGCCSWVALSSTDSKIRYRVRGNGVAGLVNLGRDSQVKKLIEKLIEKFLEIYYTGKMKKLE